MTRHVYKYQFNSSVPLVEIETALMRSIMAIEDLHGESKTRLEVAHFLDEKKRSCVIDSSTFVGQDLNQLFVGRLRREFGTDAFRVHRTNLRLRDQ